MGAEDVGLGPDDCFTCYHGFLRVLPDQGDDDALSSRLLCVNSHDETGSILTQTVRISSSLQLVLSLFHYQQDWAQPRNHCFVRRAAFDAALHYQLWDFRWLGWRR